MQQLYCKRSQSDLVFPTDSRCKPDVNITTVFRSNATKGAGKVEPSTHFGRRGCMGNFTAMPHAYYQGRVGKPTFETVTRSHGPHCQQQRCGCARCPSLPYLNSPFDPSSSTNQLCLSTATNLANNIPSDYLTPQTGLAQTSEQDIASMQYDFPYPFAFSGQSTMEVLSTNGAHVASSDIASRTSTTPQQSYVSTPATVLSVSQKSNRIRHESDLGTPTSAHDGYEGYQSNNQFTSHLHNEQREHNKDIDVGPELVEEQLSNYDHDRVNYIQDVDFDITQEQTEDTTFETETYNGTDFITPQEDVDSLRQFSNENSYLSLDQQYALTEVPTTVGKRADPAFSYDLFSVPGSAHGYGLRNYQEDNAYLVQTQQDVYGSVQPTPRSAYGSAYDNFDFNQPSAYPNMFAGHGMHLGTLPSNISPVADGSPARQNGGTRARVRNNDDMDSKLLQWRGEGKSYREIRDLGNWGLEESTLRGRYRTLIKSKEQRLRKPNWPDTAISAMFEAVELFVPASATKLNGKEAAAKIPWKKVAEWMRDNRGCYLYGNATVKKKYVEEAAKRKQVRRRTMV